MNWHVLIFCMTVRQILLEFLRQVCDFYPQESTIESVEKKVIRLQSFSSLKVNLKLNSSVVDKSSEMFLK